MNQLKSNIILAGLLLGLTLFASAEDPHVRVSLQSSMASVAAGDSFEVMLRQDIDDGWHTYWLNPGDSGAPPTINWRVPDGVRVGEFEWPYPERIPYGPLMNFGYHHTVDLLFTVEVDESFTGDHVALKGEGRVLVCEDICIPEKVSVELRIPVGARLVDEEASALFANARQKIPVALGIEGSWHTEGNLIRIEVPVPVAMGGRIEEVHYFPTMPDQIDNMAGVEFEASESGLSLTLKQGFDFKPSGAELSGVLVIRESAGEEIVSAFEVKVSGAGEALVSRAGDGSSPGLLLAMLLAFVGGLILNLMPCVFPVLSIKILSLIEGAQSQSAVIRLHGWIYTLGVVISFVAIAAVLIALRVAGESVGWGFQLQSPIVVGLLAYLFFMIGLNLLGLFEIGTSIMSLGKQEGDGLSGSFLTGVLATIVAAPCTAPFMGAAVGYALTQPAWVALLVFGSLGLGMAVPYLALCYSPGLLSRMPRPGAWMQTLRQVLAFPMFASAIWLLWVLGIQAGVTGMMQVLAGMLLLALAVFLLTLSRPGSSRIIVRIVSAGLIAAALYLVISQVPEKRSEEADKVQYGAESWSPEALASALEEGPVFVNFTAAWCITCKVNELNALQQASVKQAFAEEGITYLVGDWTNEDPRITRALEEHGRSGVPLYLLYADKFEAPRLLPQLLTEDIVLDAIRNM